MHHKPILASFQAWRDSNSQLLRPSESSSSSCTHDFLSKNGWRFPPDGPNLGGKCVVITGRKVKEEDEINQSGF
jgi:hypothetical protein